MIKSFKAGVLSLGLIVSMSAEAQLVQPILGWKYVAQNDDLWKQAQIYLQEKNYSDNFSIAERILKAPKSTPSQKAEAYLIRAQTIKELGYSSLALDLFFHIVREFPGTQASYSALTELNQSLPKNLFNQEEFQALFNRGAFKEVPENVVSLISYFTALDNMSKGLYSWVQNPVNLIDKKSYWHYQLQYFSAISLVKDKKLAKAEQLFEELEKSESVPENIRQKAALQRARLLTTRQHFDDAEAIYAKNSVTGRAMGRILYERAFVRYKNRDYSTSLGMLKTLKAPYFETALNPEHFMLAMMIYRDLCYYGAVKKVNTDFESRYGTLITHLKNGKDPKDSLILMRRALQDGQLKEYADLVDQTRKESKTLEADNQIPNSLKKEYKAALASVAARIEDRLRLPLKQKLEILSNELIDTAEQVRLLSYISGLDQYRLKSNYENRDYSTDTVNTFSFEKLYWPVTTEYWWDEFPFYRVLITDRCDARAGSRTK